MWVCAFSASFQSHPTKLPTDRLHHPSLCAPLRSLSPPKTRNARTAAKPRTPSHKRSVRDVRDSSARLRQVLEAKITKPSRSTKPLTLPEDVQLQTSKRAGRGGKAAEQVGPEGGATGWVHGV